MSKAQTLYLAVDGGAGVRPARHGVSPPVRLLRRPARRLDPVGYAPAVLHSAPCAGVSLLAAAILAAALSVRGCGGDGGTPNEGSQLRAGRRCACSRGPGADIALVPGHVRLRPGPGPRRLPRHRLARQVDRAAAGARVGCDVARRPAVPSNDGPAGERRRPRRLRGGGGRRDARLRRPVPSCRRPGSTSSSPSRSAGDRSRARSTSRSRTSRRRPAVGSKAFPSRTPTIASTGGDLAALTTRTPPDVGLLRYSVPTRSPTTRRSSSRSPRRSSARAARAARSSTSSTTCASGSGTSPVRFIHVEIYEDNQPPETNRWVKEWKLPDRAVGVPRRPRRQDQGALRGLGIRRRARGGRARDSSLG